MARGNDDFSDLEFGPEMETSLIKIDMPDTERLVFTGRRNSDLLIEIKRGTADYQPDRDALMLDAVLSTSLDPETYARFVQYIIMKYSGLDTGSGAWTKPNKASAPPPTKIKKVYPKQDKPVEGEHE